MRHFDYKGEQVFNDVTKLSIWIFIYRYLHLDAWCVVMKLVQQLDEFIESEGTLNSSKNSYSSKYCKYFFLPNPNYKIYLIVQLQTTVYVYHNLIYKKYKKYFIDKS